MPRKPRNSTQRRVTTVGVLLHRSFKTIHACSQCNLLDKTCLTLPQSEKCVKCVHLAMSCDLFLSEEEVKVWVNTYQNLKQRRKAIFQIICQYYQKVDAAR